MKYTIAALLCLCLAATATAQKSENPGDPERVERDLPEFGQPISRSERESVSSKFPRLTCVGALEGRRVFVENPRIGGTMWQYDTSSSSPVRDLVDALGGELVTDRRDAELVATTTGNVAVAQTATRSERYSNSYTFGGRRRSYGGSYSDRSSNTSREASWKLSANLEVVISGNGGSNGSVVVARLTSSIERDDVRFRDAEVSRAWGSFFRVSDSSSSRFETGPEAMRQAALAMAFADLRETSRSQAVSSAMTSRTEAAPVARVVDGMHFVVIIDEARAATLRTGQKLKITRSLGEGDDQRYKVGEGIIADVTGQVVKIFVPRIEGDPVSRKDPAKRYFLEIPAP